MMAAVFNGHTDTVQYLKEHGAGVATTDAVRHAILVIFRCMPIYYLVLYLRKACLLFSWQCSMAILISCGTW